MKIQKNKRICSVLILSILISTVIMGRHVFADKLLDLEKQKQTLDVQKSDIKSGIQVKEDIMIANKSEIDTILSQIQSINLEISRLDSDTVPLETSIIQTMEEIELLHNSILGIEKKTHSRDIVLRERLRTLQVTGGPISYIDVLIGASSFSNFIERFNSVTTLLEADRHIINQQMAEYEELQQIKSKIDQSLSALKEHRFELQKMRSTLTSLTSEKNNLIDALEISQKQITYEKNQLQINLDETYKMSEEVEMNIRAEQERIFREEKNRLSSAYCRATGDVDKDVFFKKLRTAGVFTDKGQQFIDIANEYGVDPVLMAAIALQETAKGTSNAVTLYKNPGGLMDPSDNWESIRHFETLEDGLITMAKTLNRLIIKEGRVTIKDLGSAYAPVGANNDPLGLNEYWVPNVSKNVVALGGLTMNCEAVVDAITVASSISNGKWTSPAKGVFSSQFGWRSDPFTGEERQHRGLDIANAVGTTVVAASGGVISKAGWHDSYGNMIMITHLVEGQAYTTVYAHLSGINVQEGQQVSMGQQIGEMGSTGRSTGPHLHFEFHIGYYSGNGPSAVNPLRYIHFP